MNLEEALECVDMWTGFKKPRANARGLSAAAAVLAEEVRRLRKGEFICMRCGIRKDGEHDSRPEF